MSRVFVRLFLCALICVPLCTAEQPTATQPETTIRTNADLVVVDVTVSDAQQNAVHGLAATEFTVNEDGKPQTLKVFPQM